MQRKNKDEKISRLTLTWDVFKLLEEGQTVEDILGLTLTWDVFK